MTRSAYFRCRILLLLAYTYRCVCSSHNEFLNYTSYIASNRKLTANDELKSMQKEVGRSGLVFGYYPSICLDKVQNATKNLVQDRWFLGQEESLGPPKYEAGI
jgi:hypothetical protein